MFMMLFFHTKKKEDKLWALFFWSPMLSFLELGNPSHLHLEILRKNWKSYRFEFGSELRDLEKWSITIWVLFIKIVLAYRSILSRTDSDSSEDEAPAKPAAKSKTLSTPKPAAKPAESSSDSDSSSDEEPQKKPARTPVSKPAAPAKPAPAKLTPAAKPTGKPAKSTSAAKPSAKAAESSSDSDSSSDEEPQKKTTATPVSKPGTPAKPAVVAKPAAKPADSSSDSETDSSDSEDETPAAKKAKPAAAATATKKPAPASKPPAPASKKAAESSSSDSDSSSEDEKKVKTTVTPKQQQQLSRPWLQLVQRKPRAVAPNLTVQTLRPRLRRLPPSLQSPTERLLQQKPPPLQ